MGRKLFGVWVLLLISLFTHGKNSITYPDAGSWNTISLDYALNKKWSILLAEELRIKENYSRLNLFYTNFGFEYNYSKNFKTSLVYRQINKYNDDNTFTYRHRLMWDATIKTKVKKLSLSFRHRLQVEYRSLQSTETGRIPEWYSRSKFEIGYQATTKISPYFSAEFRYQVNDVRNIESDHTWHRTRWQMGIDYRINKFSKAGIYYLIQKEYNVSLPENMYITGLEYSISLADTGLFKKKKKKK
jgi:Protein of unknown function (DUF2490)